MAELTDQVRKAMRDDWRAHVERQAVEAHNAASSHNSEQQHQVVKNLARKQSRVFKCTRIRLEDGKRPRHDGFTFTLGISTQRFSLNRSTMLHCCAIG